MRVPMPLFEGATVIYDNDGKLVRSNAADLQAKKKTAAIPDVAAPDVTSPQPMISIE